MVGRLGTALVTAALLSACAHAMPPTSAVSSDALTAMRVHPWTGHYQMSEHDIASGDSPGGEMAKDVTKPLTQTKHLSWKGDVKSAGSGATATDITSDDLSFGRLSMSAESDATNGSVNGSAEGQSEVDALWGDEIMLSSNKPPGTLELFTLELNVGNPRYVGGSSGRTAGYIYSLQVGAVLEDLTGTTFGVYFQRYSSDGTNKGNPGVNKLAVKLPVGTAVSLTGVVGAFAQAGAPDPGDASRVTVEVDDASICLLPPAGVALISASGHVYRRC